MGLCDEWNSCIDSLSHINRDFTSCVHKTRLNDRDYVMTTLYTYDVNARAISPKLVQGKNLFICMERNLNEENKRKQRALVLIREYELYIYSVEVARMQCSDRFIDSKMAAINAAT